MKQRFLDYAITFYAYLNGLFSRLRPNKSKREDSTFDMTVISSVVILFLLALVMFCSDMVFMSALSQVGVPGEFQAIQPLTTLAGR